MRGALKMVEAALGCFASGTSSILPNVDGELRIEVHLRMIMVAHFGILYLIWRLVRRKAANKIHKRLIYFWWGRRSRDLGRCRAPRLVAWVQSLYWLLLIIQRLLLLTFSPLLYRRMLNRGVLVRLGCYERRLLGIDRLLLGIKFDQWTLYWAWADRLHRNFLLRRFRFHFISIDSLTCIVHENRRKSLRLLERDPIELDRLHAFATAGLATYRRLRRCALDFDEFLYQRADSLEPKVKRNGQCYVLLVQLLRIRQFLQNNWLQFIEHHHLRDFLPVLILFSRHFHALAKILDEFIIVEIANMAYKILGK